MLYNLDWLAEGQMFPPESELARLQMYRDNRALFNGDSEEVLKPYQDRIQRVIDSFVDLAGFNAKDRTRFGLDLNYFQATTIKTGDLVAGTPPTMV